VTLDDVDVLGAYDATTFSVLAALEDLGFCVNRNFTAVRPDETWVADIERHEALLNRAVVKGHRLRLVAAGR
jgi:hypothetical protein